MWNDIYRALREEAQARERAKPPTEIEKALTRKIQQAKDWTETQRWMGYLNDVRCGRKIPVLIRRRLEL